MSEVPYTEMWHVVSDVLPKQNLIMTKNDRDMHTWFTFDDFRGYQVEKNDRFLIGEIYHIHEKTKGKFRVAVHILRKENNNVR